MMFSLIVPVYNEQDVIEKVVQEFEDDVLSKLPNAEFILIDDCSTDSTPKILENLKKKYSNLRVVRPPQNGGHGKALLLGYRAAHGDYVFHSDSDYQNKPGQFWLLYEKIKENDIVIGYRQDRHDPVGRKIISYINRLLCFFLFGLWLRDPNSPFKIYSKTALDKVLPHVEAVHPFSPSIGMIVTARKLGLKVCWLPVTHLPRLTGQVSIVKWGLIKACFNVVGEHLRLKRQLKKEGIG